MKQALFLLTCIFLFSCEEELIKPNPMLKEVFPIASKETGRAYEISVQLPDNYEANQGNYPTMYVLDARQDEEYVASICKKASSERGTRNAIVVGIRFTEESDRNIDYTPTPTAHGKGGSPAFLAFIKKELIPRIQAQYRTDTLRSSRAILGHSFGGLCGAYALTRHNEVFGIYLLLSPSLFYDNSIVLKYEQQFRASSKDIPQLVFIGLGEGHSENRLHPANDLLRQRLGTYYPNTKVQFNVVAGRGHMGSKDINIDKAISFYFNNR